MTHDCWMPPLSAYCQTMVTYIDPIYQINYLGKLSLKLDVTLRTVHSWFHADRFNCTDAEVICLTMYFLFKMIVPILMHTRKETQFYGLNKYEKKTLRKLCFYIFYFTQTNKPS
jgi:hypothetical protein